RVRDRRRVLRLLPRLSRVLEALRHGSARRGPAEGLLRDYAPCAARAAAGRLARGGPDPLTRRQPALAALAGPLTQLLQSRAARLAIVLRWRDGADARVRRA